MSNAGIVAYTMEPSRLESVAAAAVVVVVVIPLLIPPITMKLSGAANKCKDGIANAEPINVCGRVKRHNTIQNGTVVVLLLVNDDDDASVEVLVMISWIMVVELWTPLMLLVVVAVGVVVGKRMGAVVSSLCTAENSVFRCLDVVVVVVVLDDTTYDDDDDDDDATDDTTGLFETLRNVWMWWWGCGTVTLWKPFTPTNDPVLPVVLVVST